MSAAGKRGGGRFSYLANATESKETPPPRDAEAAQETDSNSSLAEREEPRSQRQTQRNGGQGRARSQQKRSSKRTATTDALASVPKATGRMKQDILWAVRGHYKLLCIRQRRLLQRIARLRELGEDTFILVSRDKRQDHNRGGPVELTIETRRRVAEEMYRMEAVLDKISDTMITAVDQLDRYERHASDQHTFDDLLEAIERSGAPKEEDC